MFDAVSLGGCAVGRWLLKNIPQSGHDGLAGDESLRRVPLFGAMLCVHTGDRQMVFDGF